MIPEALFSLRKYFKYALYFYVLNDKTDRISVRVLARGRWDSD